MNPRTIMVPIDYHHYSPHRIIIGIRRCPTHQAGGEADILSRMAEDNPGWSTLAVCAQEPRGWRNGWKLSVIAETIGSVADDLPLDYWNQASA